MISALEFASCYVYSPAGSGVVCERSRLLCALLKEGNERWLIRFAGRVSQIIGESPLLTGFLSATDVLVPVPGSAPKVSERAHVAGRLADAMTRQGVGGGTWRGLQRIRPIQKSATARPNRRPSLSVHYESFAIVDALPHPAVNLVLVDDVITKGRTLLAAATRLHEAFPAANVRAFALLRTMGLVPQIQRMLEPCKGSIRLTAGDARRNP